MADYTNTLRWVGIVGVVFGVVQILVLVRTLRTSQIQASKARDHQAQLERAYILMKPPTVRVADLEALELPSGKRKWVWVTLHVKNSGKTPATIFNCHCGFRFYRGEQLPDIPEYGHHEMKDYGRLAPLSAGMTLREYFILGNPAFDRQEEDTPHDKGALYFLGYVEYRDIFNEPHRTRFCFQISSGGSEAFFRGGEKYNSYT